MKSLDLSARIAMIGLIALGGCGGHGIALDNPSPGGTFGASSAHSWVSPDAAKNELLYVSDAANNEVYIYTYPANDLVGILTGFNNPHGLCVVPSTGDVWVTNTGASTIVRYQHGTVLPVQSLKDNGQYPVGCSVNPKSHTSTLAVSNAQSVSGGPGSVTVFVGSAPHNYPVTTMNTVAYLSFDNSGDIFVDGADLSGTFQFAELIKGHSSFKAIPLNQSIGRPGGVEGYSKYIVVGDESTNTVYLVVKGQVVGSTTLSGASEVAQFFIDGTTLIGPDDGNATIGLWKYPAGGSPIQVITGSYLNKPTGAVISGP